VLEDNRMFGFGNNKFNQLGNELVSGLINHNKLIEIPN